MPTRMPGPPLPYANANSSNMPVRIEMKAKPIAKVEKDPRVRTSSCL